jgi:hypothetical protein
VADQFSFFFARMPKSSRKRPHSGRTEQCPVLDFTEEIVEHILKSADRNTRKTLRLVCRTFARILYFSPLEVTVARCARAYADTLLECAHKTLLSTIPSPANIYSRELRGSYRNSVKTACRSLYVTNVEQLHRETRKFACSMSYFYGCGERRQMGLMVEFWINSSEFPTKGHVQCAVHEKNIGWTRVCMIPASDVGWSLEILRPVLMFRAPTGSYAWQSISGNLVELLKQP